MKERRLHKSPICQQFSLAMPWNVPKNTGNVSVDIRHWVHWISHLLIKETHATSGLDATILLNISWLRGSLLARGQWTNLFVSMGTDSLLEHHCLTPHFNYKETMKLVRIMVCCLSVIKATPPSGMWKLKLGPSLIEWKLPLELNYLLTKESCSSSHVEGEKGICSWHPRHSTIPLGVRDWFPAKPNVQKVTLKWIQEDGLPCALPRRKHGAGLTAGKHFLPRFSKVLLSRLLFATKFPSFFCLVNKNRSPC